MFYSKETTIDRINYRISVLKARSEVMNERLIKALERDKKNLMGAKN